MSTPLLPSSYSASGASSYTTCYTVDFTEANTNDENPTSDNVDCLFSTPTSTNDFESHSYSYAEEVEPSSALPTSIFSSRYDTWTISDDPSSSSTPLDLTSPSAFLADIPPPASSLPSPSTSSSPPSPPPAASDSNDNWQTRFELVLSLPSSTTAQRLDKSLALQALTNEFCSVATLVARRIVDEQMPSYALPRTLHPLTGMGVLGGAKFLSRGIFFKLTSDERGIFGSLAGACKAAKHEIKSLRELVRCNVEGLFFPLMCVVDYCGVRECDEGLDPGAVLAELARRGVNELLVECGPRLSGALMRAGRVDELLLYQAPLLLGGDAQPMLDTLGLQRLDQHARWRVIERRQLGEDQRLRLRPA